MFDKLKAKFEEDPLTTIAVCALAVTATAKLVDAMSGARNSSAWNKEVDRRVRMS